MNGATPPIRSDTSLHLRGLGCRVRRVRGSLSALSFWMAIVVPSVYVPLLVAGVDTAGGRATFLLLFGLHVFALVGGRRYGRPDER